MKEGLKIRDNYTKFEFPEGGHGRGGGGVGLPEHLLVGEGFGYGPKLWADIHVCFAMQGFILVITLSTWH